jgi:hypothetical protein
MKGLLIVMEREIVKQKLKELKPDRTGLRKNPDLLD